MTFRERIEAVLSRRPPDRVPWAPYDNLVPRGDFERELRNRGMGLCARRSCIWSQMPNVALERTTKDKVVINSHKTPEGTATTGHKIHMGRIADGGIIQCKWLIESPDDYEPVIFMIEDTVFHVDRSAYYDAVRDLGEDGIVRGEGISAPYDMTAQYFGLENWILHQKEYPEEFAMLLKAVEEQVERRLPLVLESPAKFVDCGSINGWYGPEIFREHVLPFYKRTIPMLRQRGKICSIHGHASNMKSFAKLVGELGIQVVEALTPPPVGDLSLQDARAIWGKDMVIWVNFPETVFLSGEQAVRDYTLEMLRADPPGDALIFGLTELGSYGIKDEQTEEIFKAGLRAVTEVLEEHGKYPVSAQ